MTCRSQKEAEGPGVDHGKEILRQNLSWNHALSIGFPDDPPLSVHKSINHRRPRRGFWALCLKPVKGTPH